MSGALALVVDGDAEGRDREGTEKKVGEKGTKKVESFRASVAFPGVDTVERTTNGTRLKKETARGSVRDPPRPLAAERRGRCRRNRQSEARW